MDRPDFLGTGIANLDAAKRYLRRKFNEGQRDPIMSRPGALFYVSAHQGRRTALVLGPFVSHMTALERVDSVRRVVGGPFVAVGTCSLPAPGQRTLFGRFVPGGAS
ncbi:MAG TPA: hypothetical protein VFW65_32020 [Pseudonocardiaceae bacterium]|nr:hypothetical protein [Pseudonocardiaceae bacterium]